MKPVRLRVNKSNFMLEIEQFSRRRQRQRPRLLARFQAAKPAEMTRRESSAGHTRRSMSRRSDDELDCYMQRVVVSPSGVFGIEQWYIVATLTRLSISRRSHKEPRLPNTACRFIIYIHRVDFYHLDS